MNACPKTLENISWGMGREGRAALSSRRNDGERAFRLRDKLESGRTECGGFRGAERKGRRARSRSESRRSQAAGKRPVSGNSGRGTERSGRACRWSGSLTALQRSGVERLEWTESGSGGRAQVLGISRRSSCKGNRKPQVLRVCFMGRIQIRGLLIRGMVSGDGRICTREGQQDKLFYSQRMWRINDKIV